MCGHTGPFPHPLVAISGIFPRWPFQVSSPYLWSHFGHPPPPPPLLPSSLCDDWEGAPREFVTGELLNAAAPLLLLPSSFFAALLLPFEEFILPGFEPLLTTEL